LGQLTLTPVLQNPLEQCGTILTQEHREYLANTREERESINLELFRPPAEGIHLMVHVMVQDLNDPAGFDITENEIDDAIDQMNEAFVQVGLHFRRCLPINYISEDQDYPQTATLDVYPNTSTSEATFITQDHGEPNAVNVIFTPNANGCGWATYPSASTQWILMDNDCALNGSTFAHEMGHYFNLQHTFDGPIENVARPGDNSNGCPTGVDCSNCGPGVGDELCDTPADPQGIGGYAISNCNSIATCVLTHGAANNCDLVDSNGDLYEPDPTNIMSYNWKTCRTHFSPQQINRMRATLFMGNADLLASETDFNSCFSCGTNSFFFGVYDVNTVAEYEVSNSITSTAVLSPDVTDPLDGTLVDAGANVTYDAGAFICLNPGFNAEYTSNFLAIIDGCAGQFKSGAPEFGQNLVNTLAIYPNPFSEQCSIDFNLVEDNAVTVSVSAVSVSDIMGRKIETIVNNEQKAAGKHQFTFDGSNLPVGIYYCTIQTSDHIETKKMVLAK